jgi:hemerythrin-like domain-containing protein
MRALEGMCLRIIAGGDVPDEELAKLFDFIRHFADGFHHAKEDTYLFPMLEKIGVRNENGPLAFLRGEHETERALLVELDAAAADYRSDQAASEKFVSAALQFKDHLIGHMQQEDSILFRLVEEALDEDAKDTLNRAFAEENARAAELTRQYEQMASELERKWAM